MSVILDILYNLTGIKLFRNASKVHPKSRQNSCSYPVYMFRVDELKKVFDKFDSNGDGKISPDEYKAVLRSLGYRSFLKREVQKVFGVADSNGDGYIDFEEFVEVQRKEGGFTTMDFQSAFQVFDRDGDGKICPQEVFELLQRIGERCTLQDCQRMVSAVDVNGDGVVDIDEFTAMMTRDMTLC